jgi:hypothetical protein
VYSADQAVGEPAPANVVHFNPKRRWKVDAGEGTRRESSTPAAKTQRRRAECPKLLDLRQRRPFTTEKGWWAGLDEAHERIAAG